MTAPVFASPSIASDSLIRFSRNVEREGRHEFKVAEELGLAFSTYEGNDRDGTWE